VAQAARRDRVRVEQRQRELGRRVLQQLEEVVDEPLHRPGELRRRDRRRHRLQVAGAAQIDDDRGH
jgi:hypothetical protein